MTCKGLGCPGLDSNQHVQKDTAPSRQRVYQFRHPGGVVYFGSPPSQGQAWDGGFGIVFFESVVAYPSKILYPKFTSDPARARTWDPLINLPHQLSLAAAGRCSLDHLFTRPGVSGVGWAAYGL